MRLVLVMFAAALALSADEIQAFGFRWTVPVASDWKVKDEGPAQILRMLVERPQREPERQTQFALADTEPWQRVTLEAEVKRIGGSLILVYAWQDPTHFNYAHLSVDTAVKQPVHNGIFHVFGGERVRISPVSGPASLPSSEEWYRVRLNYYAKTGEAVVVVNGQKNPSLRAIDLSLGAGKVGIGSFFETALFRNVKISGIPASR